MEHSSQNSGSRSREEADRVVFREVLASLLRAELYWTKLQRRSPIDGGRPGARTPPLTTEGKLRRARILLTRIQRLSQALKVSDVELRQAHAQLAEAQRLSKTGSFTSDLQMNRHQWSDEYYRIFELERGSQPSVEAVRERVHADDLPIFDAEIRRGIAGANADFTFRIVTPSAGVKHLRGVARVIDQVDGRPIFMGTIQDITQSKLAEAAIRASEANLRQVNSYLTEAQSLSKTGTFTWDVLADDHTWSAEIFRTFGFPLDAKVSLALIQAAIHPDDLSGVERVIGGALEGRDFDHTFRILTSSGAIRHAHVVAHRIQHLADRPVFLGALQDVTDRKVAEEGLAQARSELAHVARASALSLLTASVAHEVNQPLAGIIANASSCLRMLAADPPNIEGARVTTQRTIRDSNRASEVITRLRALFAKRPTAEEPVDLNDAAREILVLSSSELQQSRVLLHTDFAEGLPPVVGDRVQLQQVILNLVLNATQAMRGIDGRPHDLRVSTAFDEREVELSVRDSGPGAAAENLEELFNAFYTTKPDGMGIGLSISRSIILAHGGQLRANANDGPGLTVSFSIPFPARR